MKKTFKLCASLVMCLTIFSLFFIGFNSAAAAEISSYEMLSGASVRISVNGNGLRFISQMDKPEYDALKGDTNFKEVSFGILIAPLDYLTPGKELTLENVFGANPIYDFAVNGEYTPSGKVRIMNLVSENMTTNKQNNNIMEHYGSIVNIRNGEVTAENPDGISNLTREFVGLGYIRKVDNSDKITYKFGRYASNSVYNNARSMVYVSQMALDDANSSLSETEKSYLQTNYIDKSVSNGDLASYMGKYYKENFDGSFGESLSDQQTIPNAIISAKLDSSTAGLLKTFENFSYDRIEFYNDKGALLNNGKVLANDKLVVKVYYKANLMLDLSQNVSLLSPNTLSGIANTLDTNKNLTFSAKKFNMASNVFEDIASSNIIWSSQDENIVNVNNGTIQAVKQGKTSVTMSYGSQTKTCAVDVVSPIKTKADLDYIAKAAQHTTDIRYLLWAGSYVLMNDIDYAGQYLMPIASYLTPTNSSGIGGINARWGIYGNLNPGNAASFSGSIEGNGHKIANAIIPYGSSVDVANGGALYQCFIGDLAKGASLKNIAFTNIVFETFTQAKLNTAYYDTKNNSNWTAELASVNYGVLSCRSGIISHNSGIVENIFINTSMGYSGWAAEACSGALVSINQSGGIVRNCIAKLELETGINQSRVGTIVAKTQTGDKSIINCLVISKTISNDIFGLMQGYQNFGIPDISDNFTLYTNVANMLVSQTNISVIFNSLWSFDNTNNTISFNGSVVYAD